MLVIRPKRWGRWDGGPLPSYGTQLNTGHPLAVGMVCCYLFNMAGGRVLPNLCRRELLRGAVGDAVIGQHQFLPYGYQAGSASPGTPGIDIGTSGPTLGNGANWAWDCLFRFDASGGSYATLFNGPSFKGMYLHSSKLDFYDGSDHDGTAALTAGRHYHVFATAIDTSISFFINGVFDKTVTSSGTWTPQFLTRNTSGAESIDGLFAMQRVWQRAVAPTEIMEAYLDPFGCFVPQAQKQRSFAPYVAPPSSGIGSFLGQNILRPAVLNGGMTS